jgi:hypothetical protein
MLPVLDLDPAIAPAAAISALAVFDDRSFLTHGWAFFCSRLMCSSGPLLAPSHNSLAGSDKPERQAT